jgi:exonuclease SbcC
VRPLELEMQAFGPYAGTERVDFTRLGEAPLFLICGPTGAGKTSILDGICYALYGDSAGGGKGCDAGDVFLCAGRETVQGPARS